MAHAIFETQVAARSLLGAICCDSAGTQHYHAGEEADSRTRACLRERGIHKKHCAKKVTQRGMGAADYIVAMDKANRADLLAMSKENGRKLCLMRDFDTQGRGGDVPDPYYGTPADFEALYVLLERCIVAFLDVLEERHAR